MPPEVIAGRYRVDREVGRGAFGTVWLCRDERLGREVAVKQLGHLPGGSVPDLARALREARSSAALNHRNVVAVYDAIEEGDHIWLVMEYVPGRTLADIITQDGPLPPARAAWIGAQVADGLAAAHARGTIHRDVKPGNILVTADDLAKVSDFGIARTQGDTQLTQTGLMTGTPAYFSPELARGEEPSPAADVWALGATLFAAVEGHSPYPEKPNAIALLTTIASEPPPLPQRAGVLTEPLNRMLDVDPAARWEMADCAHALHRIHDQHAAGGTREETLAAPVAAAQPTTQPAAASPPSDTSTWASDPEPEERKPRRAGLLVGILALLAALVLAVAVGWSLLGPEGEGSETASDDPTASASSQATEDTSDASPQEDPTTQETTDEPPEETSEPAAPSGSGGRQGFVEDYYSVLPDDTDAGWSMLSPSYQAQTSYEDYDGFWSTIGSVEVLDTQPAGSDAVDVTLTYDGGSQETRRIYLERADDGYLIVDDEVVG